MYNVIDIYLAVRCGVAITPPSTNIPSNRRVNWTTDLHPVPPQIPHQATTIFSSQKFQILHLLWQPLSENQQLERFSNATLISRKPNKVPLVADPSWLELKIQFCLVWFCLWPCQHIHFFNNSLSSPIPCY